MELSGEHLIRPVEGTMVAGRVEAGTKVDPQDGSKVQGAKSEGMQQLHCSEVNGISEVERTKVRETNG